MNEHLGRDDDVLRISTTIRQPKHLIPILKPTLSSSSLITESLNDTAKLHTHGLRRLRRQWVQTLALQQIHTVQAEGADLDERLARCGDGLGDVGDVHGRGGAFAALDG